MYGASSPRPDSPSSTPDDAPPRYDDVLHLDVLDDVDSDAIPTQTLDVSMTCLVLDASNEVTVVEDPHTLIADETGDDITEVDAVVSRLLAARTRNPKDNQMSSTSSYGEDEDTLAARPPRNPSLVGLCRLHNYDFKLPEGGGGATYERQDPSRITIRLGNEIDYFQLTVDEGIALRLLGSLNQALDDFYATRRSHRSTRPGASL